MTSLLQSRPSCIRCTVLRDSLVLHASCERFKRYFFVECSGRAEAWFRVGYALVLFIEQLELASKLELLFANTGVHPASPLDALYSRIAITALFWLWMAAVVLLGIGVRVRASALVNWILCVYFFGLRGNAAPHAADWLAHSLAFYLMFMRSDTRLSLDHRFSWVPERRVQAWPKRLAQINVASVYFTAGLAKLADDYWVMGRAFSESLRHPFVTRFSSGLAFDHPDWFSFVDYLVVGWELALPLLLLVRRTRRWALLSALAFNVLVLFSLRIGLFTVLASVALLLFIDDVSWRKASELPHSESTLRPASALAKVFVPVHLVAVAMATLGHLSLGLRQPALGRALLELPVISIYTRTLAGLAYFDVWNSRFLLDPVRLITYRVTHPTGEPGALEPFDENGAFNPDLGYFNEVREGILSIRLASYPAPPALWSAYVRYLVRKYRRQYAWSCPAELRIYRIAEPLARFGRDPSRLDVPRKLVLTAQPSCGPGATEPKIRFAVSIPAAPNPAVEVGGSAAASTTGLNSRAGR